MKKWIVAALCYVSIVGCGRSPSEPTAPALRSGKWGGPQVEITITSDELVFTTATCVRGHFAPPAVHEDGTFFAEGSLEPMAGPPPAPPFPHGRIVGSVTGNSLVISATYDYGTVIGPLKATYLAPGPVFYPCPV